MKKYISFIISALLMFMPLLQSNASAYNSEEYVINGVTIPIEGYEVWNYWDNCWTFARLVYSKIWGTYDGYDLLGNITDKEDLTITEEHTRQFIGAAPLGSNIRVDAEDNVYMHSLVLIDKDDNGFTVYHGNYNGRIAITYYTYRGFASDFASYKYFDYITCPNTASVTVNGSEIEFDAQPTIVSGRTLVPVRAIFEALGASVEWDGDTQTVTSTLNGTTVTLTIGSKTMYKNGAASTLDVPAQMINDRTFIPARAVAEAFGCNVNWDGDTKTVIIES